jgi:hypothetical protein
VAAIVLAGAVAYSNTLQGAFVFDDDRSIAENRSIRSLWRLELQRRRTGCRSYQVFDLGIHMAAALTLFGLVAAIPRLFRSCWAYVSF